MGSSNLWTKRNLRNDHGMNFMDKEEVVPLGTCPVCGGDSGEYLYCSFECYLKEYDREAYQKMKGKGDKLAERE